MDTVFRKTQSSDQLRFLPCRAKCFRSAQKTRWWWGDSESVDPQKYRCMPKLISQLHSNYVTNHQILLKLERSRLDEWLTTIQVPFNTWNIKDQPMLVQYNYFSKNGFHTGTRWDSDRSFNLSKRYGYPLQRSLWLHHTLRLYAYLTTLLGYSFSAVSSQLSASCFFLDDSCFREDRQTITN